MLKNQKLAVRIGIYIGIAMMLTFFVIWVVMDGNATDIVTDSITNQMTDSAESRVAIINDYVSWQKSIWLHLHKVMKLDMLCFILTIRT